MTEESLKSYLIQIQQQDIEWNEIDVNNVVREMFDHIQTTDIELKEKLIEPLLSEMVQYHLTESALEALAKKCVDEEHLYKEIGDTVTRYKMTRAFSMYVIKELVERDVKDVFLSHDTFDLLKREVILYTNLEQDYRFYTEDMGWVNSVRFSLEALYAIVQNTRLDPAEYTQIFQTVMNKIFTAQIIYQYDEGEITVDFIQLLLEKGFSEQKIIDFLERVPAFLEGQKEKMTHMNYWNLYKNCKSLLRSLYIRLDLCENQPLLLAEVKKCLSKISFTF